MAKNNNKNWTKTEDKFIKTQAQKGVSTKEISKKLGRTEAATRTEASRKKISLKPKD